MEKGTVDGGDVRRQAESTASTIVEQAQQTAETQVTVRKDAAASTLHTVAEAIRDSSRRMRGEQPQIASFADQAAAKVDEASSYIEQHDVRDFVREAENLARREPVLFLGGAFALGFVAARFLKASSPTRSDGRGRSAAAGEWYADTPRRSLAGGGASADAYGSPPRQAYKPAARTDDLSSSSASTARTDR